MPVPLQYPVLMPDTPPEIVTELGKSRAVRRLKRELITGARFQQEFMILRQERINEINRQLEYRRIEGLGEKIAEIDHEFYYQMILEYGPECWGDPDFMEDTLKRNPGMRLRVDRPVRISMRAAGNRATGRTRAPFPDLVQGIEHPAARVPGGCSEGSA